MLKNVQNQNTHEVYREMVIPPNTSKPLMDDEPKLLPLLIDMNKRKVVIFGGGQVAERKAALFSRYARTTVISRSFTPQLRECAGQGVSLIKTAGIFSDDEISHYIQDAFIVIPATSDVKLNRRIADISHRHGCLVNSVDGLEDIAVPSVIERGEIIIALSTRGASPALSKFMRKKIEQTIPAEFESMARLQKEIRQRLKHHVPKQEDRSRILWNILEDRDIWETLKESYERALDIALNHISDENV
jgi:precorrin-2 dehydrogenase/sirohydrochlorin ferrochelatase